MLALNFLPLGKPTYAASTPPTSAKPSPTPMTTTTSSSSCHRSKHSSMHTPPRTPRTPVGKPSNKPFAETGGVPWAPQRKEKAVQRSCPPTAYGSDLRSYSPLDRPSNQKCSPPKGPLTDWVDLRTSGERGDDGLMDEDEEWSPLPATRLFFTPAAAATQTSSTLGADAFEPKLKARRADGSNPLSSAAPPSPSRLLKLALLPPLAINLSPTGSKTTSLRRLRTIPQASRSSESPSALHSMVPPKQSASSSSDAAAQSSSTTSTTGPSPISAPSSAVSSLLSRRRSTRCNSTVNPPYSSSTSLCRIRSGSSSHSTCADAHVPVSPSRAGSNANGSLGMCYSYAPPSPLTTSTGRSRTNSAASASSLSLARMDCCRDSSSAAAAATATGGGGGTGASRCSTSTAAPGPSPMLTRLRSYKEVSLTRSRSSRSRSSSLSRCTSSSNPPGANVGTLAASMMARARTMTPDYFGSWEASVPLAQRRGRRVEMIRHREMDLAAVTTTEDVQNAQVDRKRTRVLREGGAGGGRRGV